MKSGLTWEQLQKIARMATSYMNKRQYLHGMTKWVLIINPAQQLYEYVLSGNSWVRNGSTPCNSWNLDQFNSYRSKRSVTYTGLEIRKAVCFRKQHDTGIHFSPLSSSIDSLVPYTKIAEIDKYMPLTICMGLSWNAHRHIYIYLQWYKSVLTMNRSRSFRLLP